MSDIKKGTPVRSESEIDAVRVKLVDPTTESQQQTVDAEGNAHVQVMGDRADDAAEVALLLSEEGRVNPRGDYEADENSKPATIGLIAHARNAAPDDTQLDKRPTAVVGEGDATALDVAIRDAAGNIFDEDNPLPTYLAEDPGEEIHDFDEGVDVAAGGTSNHEYVVPDGKTFLLWQIAADCSTRHKWELQIGDGAATEAFTTKAVRFNSEKSGGAADLPFKQPIKVVGTVNGTTVRLIRTNRDNNTAASIYTAIVGKRRDT